MFHVHCIYVYVCTHRCTFRVAFTCLHVFFVFVLNRHGVNMHTDSLPVKSLLPLWCRCRFSFKNIVLFFNKQILFYFGGVCWRISRHLRPWISRTLTFTQNPPLWDWTIFGPTQTTESPRPKPLVQQSQRSVCRSKKEEEGSVDPATLLRWRVRIRTPQVI